MATFFIVVLILVAAGMITKRYIDGRGYVTTIRDLQDTEPWRAACEVTQRAKPRAVELARQQLADAERKMGSAVATKDPRAYGYAEVDFNCAKGAIDDAVRDDPTARWVYDQVAAVYRQAVLAHPFNAKKLYLWAAAQVEQIITQGVETSPKLAAIRPGEGGQRVFRTPSGTGDVDDVVVSLYDGRFNRWSRNRRSQEGDK